MGTKYYILHLTHKTVGLDELGKFHVSVDREKEALERAIEIPEIHEVFFLSTCNRVEIVFATESALEYQHVKDFMQLLYPELTKDDVNRVVNDKTVVKGKEAVKHMFRVASSLDSLVVGEREIITQVRTAFERCWDYGFAGDNIRVLIRKTIETAKKVYTETNIAGRPVSVVNLAYRKLRNHAIKDNARFVFVGAGKTNKAMVRFLKKHDYENFVFFNRTQSRAEELAKEVEGRAYSLDAIDDFKEGFDVLISCTGAEETLVTKSRYESLLQGETDQKIVIDLAMPFDIDAEIMSTYNVHYIGIKELQDIAAENIEYRKTEIKHCDAIIKQALLEFGRQFEARQVERAMRAVPEKVKEIKHNALNTVYAREIEALDDTSRETLEKVINYMEKKYMSTPMKMAKEILLKGSK